jgi:hypothetical protein
VTSAFASPVAGGQNGAVSKLDISNATCALCGAGVHIEGEGRVACNGCGLATDNCTCTGEGQQDRSARQSGRGGGAGASA